MNKTIDVASTMFEGANNLRLYVHYDKGNGWNKKMGYYLSVRPIEKSTIQYCGVTMEQVAFAGVDDRARSYLLETAERYSKKVFEGYAGCIEKNRQEIHDAVAAGDYRSVWKYVYEWK